MSVKLSWGWVIQDQAASVPGLHFGPGWMQGRRRTGPLGGGYHNLLVKDILFYGNGKGALGAIVEQMDKMGHHKVRCGIRPGMVLEKFVPSEYGGGDNQVNVEATESDIVRNPYYLYVFPEEKSPYEFKSLSQMLVNNALGFVPAATKATEFARSVILDAGGAAAGMIGSKKSDLQRALGAKKVFVLLTGKRLPTGQPLSEHRHTHRISTLAKDIKQAVLHGR